MIIFSFKLNSELFFNNRQVIQWLITTEREPEANFKICTFHLQSIGRSCEEDKANNGFTDK